MPVYNEEASIRKVLLEWGLELSRWTQSFHFLVIDDGSTDETANILDELKQSEGSKLTILSQRNIGHGQTCLRGYTWAIRQNVRYVLQLDSDGQCDPKFFHEFWSQREKCDVIYGRRFIRDDGMFRSLASKCMRITIALSSLVVCCDANVPYRLMQTSVLPPVLAKIPPEFHLANVALAVLLRKSPGVKHGCVSIRFRKRYGGTPSVRFGKFIHRAWQLVGQLRTLP